MSSIDEDIINVPWVGPLSSKNILTVAVVSQNIVIIERISEALRDVHNKGDFRWKLVVLQLFNLDDIMKQSDLTGRIAIDFVVLAIDTNKMVCLDWTKTVLSQVHTDLRTRRVILVNAGGQPMNAMAVDAVDLITFKNEHKLDLLTADVKKPEDALFLARRLVKHLEVTIGVKTGIPNFNV